MSQIVEFDQKFTEAWPKQKKVRFCKYLDFESKWMIQKPKWQVFCRHLKYFYVLWILIHQMMSPRYYLMYQNPKIIEIFWNGGKKPVTSVSWSFILTQNQDIYKILLFLFCSYLGQFLVKFNNLGHFWRAHCFGCLKMSKIVKFDQKLTEIWPKQKKKIL